MGTLVNEVGNKYGRLLVIERSGSTSNGQAAWLCRCECGKTIIVSGPSMRKGYAQSCGCLGGRIPGRRILLKRMNHHDKDVYTKYLSRKRGEYGVSEDDLRNLMDNQRGMCAICKTSLVLGIKGGAHIDHNHTTGEVRGFLCNNCNRGLGHLQDSADTCMRAATYLMAKGEYNNRTKEGS